MNENKKLMSGIKSKLLAAVCMLLVAVIMVVSSTYAWFTLSTAPEVTGITTAVGANGALEMLLLTYDATINDWVYNEGMVKDGDDKNTYWGNIVDVSGETGTDYGLSQISLYPSKLNTDAIIKKGTTFSDSILKSPVYGSDGRVSKLVANTVTGTLDGTNGFIPNDDAYGIRAVGVSSGMTNRQLAYRNALSSATIAASNARNAAAASLDTNGSSLADIALKQGLNDNATYTKTELKPLYDITVELLSDNGPFRKIEEAYMNYIVALFASAKVGTNTAAESIYSTIQGYVNDAIAQEVMNDSTKILAVDYLLDKIEEPSSTFDVTLPDMTPLTSKISLLTASIAKVQEAYSDLYDIQNGADNEFGWSDISDAVGNLVVASALKVNNKTVTDVKNDISGFASEVATGAGIKVAMESGAGIYADIADHCGNYNAGITIPKIEYGGFSLKNIGASMETKGVSPSYLSTVGNVFTGEESEYGMPENSGADVLPISEFYGYIIDLAFKTNAANSNLLLQTNATDRIYDDNQNEKTAGNGSNMVFKSSSIQFDNEDVAALMSYIRIVFFEEVTQEGAAKPVNTILATAKLDVKNHQITAEGVKADMYLYTTDEVKVYTVTNADNSLTVHTVYEVEETITTGEGESATTSEVTKYYTNYYDGTNKEDVSDTINALYTDGVLNSNVKVSDSTVERRLNGTDAVIKGLTQNKAHNIHVLVYLDGENVKNEHVAATSEGASSMTGSMNLQFASSAALVPMEYKDLHQAATAAPETSPETGGEEQG